ncbi:HAD-IIIA family hydrolase [Bdellovibrio svalbardensis]|uniref:D,D-heptose 1,7-bisphosphate phosphatase n=1 Tax=Bdellovibrio svalbardensis TaxID=2972972 RepID=A0ABT6DFY4_9BACT|nr:HAD-IIIA family hydrolase [Bdellovibrio svalbardensis]MDG0815742.1 HAD-IIIA family hydrolase [Bdellovibrio svalbardensis]
MQIWEQLIADTVQLGGTLVFIKEQVPADMSQWLAPFKNSSNCDLPVVTRSVQDLLSRKFQTKSQDLIFFFESQKTFISSLNSVLQGQRILLADGSAIQGIDFAWKEASLSQWISSLKAVEAYLASAKPLHENLSTQEAPCLFLDRDDVVVRNVPYNNDPAKVELMPGAVELINQAHADGFWVALVTNQSGLGRGRISWLEYKGVHQQMLQLLAAQGCWIDECVWASFIENEAVIEGRLFASLRKPRAGMFQLVHDKLRTRMADSFMVGDSATDLIAAHSAGVKHLHLFNSEKFAKEEATLREYQKNHPQFQFHVLKNLSDLKLGN